MKLSTAFSVASVLAFCLFGCSKKDAKPDATQPLEQSFQTAEPQVEQAIETVNTSLKAGNYMEAARALEPVLARGNLTEPQKQAVGTTLHQMNQAIAANPALDSKEMYELRAKMFKAIQGRSRF